MKISVTVRRATSAHNILITADATATVGDVAAALAGAIDPPADRGRSWTLRQWDGATQSVATLSPGSALVESGVRSGSTIEVGEASGTPVRRADAALLRVIDGPDRGLEIPLRPGASTVGRATDNDVRLSDRRVSNHHARIVVGERIEIFDTNSSNGVLVGDQRVARVVLGSGDVALLGSTRITVESRRPTAALPATSNDIAFVRPPVVLSRPSAVEVALPEVPGPPDRAAFPWLAMAAPLLMGPVMFAFTRSPLSLVFVALSPILMIGNYISTRVDTRRKERVQLADFDAALGAAETRMQQVLQRELGQRETLHPSVRTCVDAVFGPSSLLWSRRPEHPEFLQVRLGSGAIRPAACFGRRHGGGRPELLARLDQMTARYRRLTDAPVVADLGSVGGLGIVGAATLREAVARAVVAQVVALHSPAEVVLACLTSTADKAHWSWLEWLPHTSSPHSPLPGTHLAAEAGTGQLLLDRLDELVTARLAATPGGQRRPRGPLIEEEPATVPITPSVLVVVQDPAVDQARLTSIAERGPDAGVHVLWVAADRRSLPAACRTFLDLGDGSVAEVGMVRAERTIRPVTCESLDAATAAAVSRHLAPVVDASVPVNDESDLPRMVSVVSLLGQDAADDEALVLTRWQENGSYVDRSGPPVPRERANDLRALVGHAGVEPFSLDLRGQGPHALVGGTTGSGKSEFLQAWVLGLAHAYSPDRLTFLFVDYKGGSAFAKCVDLPHSVGLVTDLSTYLVRRALRSLRAEIRHREQLLHDKGMKDLIDFEKSGDPACPPSLVIVVDEFAALVGEVPEFVDGVVDVAQRGRSLGLHLILATQRPTNVIKDNLRANTNLRVALRMNDEHDSSDVLGSPMAAGFDSATPGRGAARTGPGRIGTFQSAFPGARTSAEPQLPPIEVVEFDFGITTPWKVPPPPRSGRETPKDIDRVVRTVSAAARLGRVALPRRPWLDVLASAYDLSKLNQRTDQRIVLGIMDDPDNQAQVSEYFHPDADGNILYVGTGGSGKTTALRSLAMAASITPRGGPVHVYGLDFSGGGLALLEPLPNVGGVIVGDDEERVARLLSMLAVRAVERGARYNAAKASSLTDYRQLAGRPREPRILLLLDGFESFKETYDSTLTQQEVYSAFHSLLMDGRAVGMHVAMTADRMGAVPNAMSGAFQRKIVLRMADEDAYVAAGVPRDILDSRCSPGRCVQVGRSQEMQLAIMGRNGTPSVQAEEIAELALAVAPAHPERPLVVGTLPAVVPAQSMPAEVGGLPVIGVEDSSLAPMGFEAEGVFVVAGPPKSEQSSALVWLAQSIARVHPELPMVHLAPTASWLSGAPQWRASITGVDQVREYAANQLRSYAQAPGNGRPLVGIFIERFPEFVGSVAESELTEIVKQVRRNGHVLFASGETSGFTGFSGLLNEAKSGRAGVLLWPEPNDGDLLKTPLPRFRKAEMPPGRGFFVQGGKTWRVQLPAVS